MEKIKVTAVGHKADDICNSILKDFEYVSEAVFVGKGHLGNFTIFEYDLYVSEKDVIDIRKLIGKELIKANQMISVMFPIDDWMHFYVFDSRNFHILN